MLGLAGSAVAAPCASGNAGLALPPGFCATVFADNLGHVRQMAATPDGTLYANSMVEGDTLSPPRGLDFLIALRDPQHTGRATEISRFGSRGRDGSQGGTGIAVYDGALYAEDDTAADDGGAIIRDALRAGQMIPAGKPERIVSGLPVTGDHPMHPFLIDPAGDLFVDLGSATNACQRKNRLPGSSGLDPCTETQSRAGIWRFSATRVGQVFSPDARYATGLRNGEGFVLSPEGALYVTQHGRDQLHENWPRLYSAKQGQGLPAEELVRLVAGGDYGWPECYFDPERNRLVLAPEYGGDGGNIVGVCASKQAAVAVFPAHWAPNDAKYYAATQFPQAWRDGAFIAFHGSWNRAPGPQGGYVVVFQALKAGKAEGPWRVFADGFAGVLKDPTRAAFRPTGLAVAADGALFISDDQHGRIWRVTYTGGH